MSSELFVTQHAKDRWEERFPHLILKAEYSRSRRLGRKRKKQFNAFLAEAKVKRERAGGVITKHYYRISRSRVIFVMALPQILITVYPFPENITDED